MTPAPAAAPEMSVQMLWTLIIVSTLAFIIVLTAIHLLPPWAKRATFAAIAFFCAFFYIGTFFLPAENSVLFFWTRNAEGKHMNWFAANEPNLGVWVKIILAFTFGLGIINLVMVHGRNIARGRPGWINSVGLLAIMLAMIFFGLGQTFVKPDQAGKYLLFPGLHGDRLAYWYDMLFTGMLVPLEGTMFSILAFFIASAAFRAFRMRSGEATLMLLSAFVIMIGQVPLGMMLTSWIEPGTTLGRFRTENVAQWILLNPNAATLRAIGFGIGVGAIAMALRVWLSLERSSLFQTGEAQK